MNPAPPFLRAEKENMVILKPSDVLEDAKASTECCKPVTSYQYHNCYGLPYQDHNYGAPPPPTPPQSPGRAAALQSCATSVGVNDVPPGGSLGAGETGGGSAADYVRGCPVGGGSTGSSTSAVGAITTPTEEAAVTSSADDSVTRCICDYSHDDGYMICCDECSVWQHIDCMGISREKIPDTYLCEECLPRKVNKHKARLLQRRKYDELQGAGGIGGGGGVEEDRSRYRRKRLSQPAQPQQPQGRRLNGSGDHCLSVAISDELCQAAAAVGTAKHCSERKSPRIGATPPLKQASSVAGCVGTAAATTRPSYFRRNSARRRPRSSGSEVPLSPEHTTTKRKRSSRSTDNLSTTDDESLVIDPCGLSCDLPSNHYDPDVEELLAVKRPEDFGSIHLDEKSVAFLRTVWAVRSLPYGRKCLEAVSAVKADTVLLTYQGRFMLRDQFLIENPEATSRCSAAALFFTYADVELCVVASLGDIGGGEARFIRRSCSPTAEVRHAVVGGKLHLAIVASQELCKGCEITIPFDGHSEFCDSSCECACGRGSACALKKGCGRRLRRKVASGTLCASATKDILCSPVVKQEAAAPDESQPLSVVADAVPTRERHNSLRIVIPASPPATIHGALSPTCAEGAHAAASSATSGGDPSSAGDVLSPGGGDKAKVVLSREERKVAAIVKAFEKLEKREERRKEALARLEHNRKCGSVFGSTGQQQALQSPASCSATAAAATANGGTHQALLTSPARAIKIEKESELVQSQQQQQFTSRRRSATGTTSDRTKETRRNRRVSEPHQTSSDNGGSGDSSHATDYHCEAVTAGTNLSLAATAASTACEPSLHYPTAQAVEIGSTSHGTLSPNYARFPKTKKHLLSEWYHETGCDRPPSDHAEPASEDRARACRLAALSPGGEASAPASPQLGSAQPPPRVPLHLSASWSPQAGSAAGRMLCASTGMPVSADSSMGSAKKRWLRQAMNEGGDHAEGGGLLLSPSTGMQPLAAAVTAAVSVPSSPAICRALLCAAASDGATASPGAAVDQAAPAHVTPAHPGPLPLLMSHATGGGDPVAAPPKKRRLARESLSLDEQGSLPSPGSAYAAAALVALTCSRPPSPTMLGDQAVHAVAPDYGGVGGSMHEDATCSSSNRDVAAVTLAKFAAGTATMSTASPADTGPVANYSERSCSDGDSSREAAGLSASTASTEQTVFRLAPTARDDSHSSAAEWAHRYNASAGTTSGSCAGNIVPNGVDTATEGQCAADHGDGLGTPAKKKVSLLEYRKRMRSNGRDTDDGQVAVATPAAGCVWPQQGRMPLPLAGEGGACWPLVTVAGTLPLLLNGRPAADHQQHEPWTSAAAAADAERPQCSRSAQRWARQQQLDIQQPQPVVVPTQQPLPPQRSHASRADRKPVSLDERLRLEFGLDADDDAGCSSPPTTSTGGLGAESAATNGGLAMSLPRSFAQSSGRPDDAADARRFLPPSAAIISPSRDQSGQGLPVDGGGRAAVLFPPLRDPAIR